MTDTTSRDSPVYAERERPIRVVVTGQVGIEKRPFLEQVASLSEQHGKSVQLAHIGDRMYAEAPDVVPGRILDLPLARLNSLRRSVFKDVLVLAEGSAHLLVNTHATFRWRHGLFPAFDHDQLQVLDADLYVTLVDSVDAIHERLEREHVIRHHLKDLLVWREEEILATEVVAGMIRNHGCFYILNRGNPETAALMLYRLMFEPHRKKIYPSFPMTHVMDMPEVLDELQGFRRTLTEHFVTFDPGDLDEKWLLYEATLAKNENRSEFTVEVNGRELSFKAREVLDVAGDIDGQIYSRDFKLIDQSDMIVSYIPELDDGRPSLSSGVERELQHAHEGTKEVYVIWRPRSQPSVFVTETATRVFRSVAEALEHFDKLGYLGTATTSPSPPPADASPKTTLF